MLLNGGLTVHTKLLLFLCIQDQVLEKSSFPLPIKREGMKVPFPLPIQYLLQKFPFPLPLDILRGGYFTIFSIWPQCVTPPWLLGWDMTNPLAKRHDRFPSSYFLVTIARQGKINVKAPTEYKQKKASTVLELLTYLESWYTLYFL